MRGLILFTALLLSGCTSELIEDAPASSPMTRSAIAQGTHYYWCDGEKIPLTVNEDYSFVLFDKRDLNTVANLSTRAGNSVQPSNLKSYSINRNISPAASSQVPAECAWTKLASADVAAYNDQIVYAAPYFTTQTGAIIGLTNIFSVKLKQEADLNILQQFALQNRAEIIYDNYMPLWYTLACTKGSIGDALSLANKAYESGLFAASDVEFMDNIKIEIESVSYNDPLYINQWALHNENGIDIGFDKVHSITTGQQSVTVAVVDTGAQIDHDDLPIQISWDAKTGTSPAKIYQYPTSSWIPHGTGTASVIGAVPNNNTGIVGIAPSSTIMPISVDFNSHTTSQLSDAIYYAARNGAAVISNSWSSTGSSSLINDAVRYALTSGRNGKGCVVVFAAGNDAWDKNMYPHANFPEILSVGNIQRSGIRSYSSNYGPNLDVMAPGSNILMLNHLNSTYYGSGTSFACPHISGVAALVLSVAPELTQHQVADVIESTSKKLDNYTFETTSGRPNGTWNYETGYGLVNTFDAVIAAAAPLTVSGTYLISKEFTRQSITFNRFTSYNFANIQATSILGNIDFNSVRLRKNSTFTAKSAKNITLKQFEMNNYAMMYANANDRIFIENLAMTDYAIFESNAKEYIINHLDIADGSSFILNLE